MSRKIETRSSKLAIASLIAGGFCTFASGQAQNSPIPEKPSLQPQIDILGSGTATLDIGKRDDFGTSGKITNSQINFSDSVLQVGISQRLYRGGIGSISLGGLTVDQSNVGLGTQFFLHQAVMDYQSKSFEAYIGRTDNPSSQLVAISTLRSDDLIDFTTLTNPFSDGKNVEEHRYSNVAAVVLNQGLRHFVNLHAQHLIGSASATESSNLNSFGVTYQFQNIPTLEAIQRVVSYGFGIESRDLSSDVGGVSNAIYAGGIFNLKPSLTNRIDLRILGSTTFGNDTKRFLVVNDTYRADATSIAVSLRSLQSPFGSPGSSLSLTAGYKTFHRDSGAYETGLALTGARRLGDGFDSVAQISYAHRSDALANAFGSKDSLVLNLGFAFNFNATLNKSIGPRRSPLNLMHSYLPN